MSQVVQVLSIHTHFHKQDFILIAQRDGKRYALFADGTTCSPTHVVPIEGIFRTGFDHHGFGAYGLTLSAEHVGKNSKTLDPICEAVYRKGYSHQMIRMYREGYHGSPFSFGDVGESGVSSQWIEGRKERYFIIADPGSTKLQPSHLTRPWAINVHMEDHFHMSIGVRVPEVYAPFELPLLLKAIETLPHASGIKGLHPANKAS